MDKLHKATKSGIYNAPDIPGYVFAGGWANSLRLSEGFDDLVAIYESKD